nr:prostaglandin reductase 1-like [Procambarus clarkii]
MVTAKVWVLDRRPQGEPVLQDFKLQEEELPPCPPGGVVVEAVYLSVDPYMRYRARQIPLNTTMVGGQVARVTDSRNHQWPVDSYMVSMAGWRTHTVFTAEQLEDKLSFISPLPDLQLLPKSLGLGVVGMPGNTAYFGLLELCKPQAGETVLVNGAAGAVGSAVVQIAKLKGCKVVASAGSEEKCKWVRELGADHVFNYKTTSVSQALAKAAPDGVHCYFDNVAGDFTHEALPHLATFGRVALCGAIASYNDISRDKAIRHANSPYDASLIITKQLRIEGFMVTRWMSRWMEGLNQMKQWVLEGKLQYKETITKGFEHMPEAFIGLFHGDNIGKAIVAV